MADSSVIEEKKSRWTELYLKEDWWSIWFAAILIFTVAIGWITKVPKVGKWTDNPASAFPPELILPLVLLIVGLCVLTTIGVAIMKLDFKRYVGGFVVVMVMSILSYFLAKVPTRAWAGPPRGSAVGAVLELDWLYLALENSLALLRSLWARAMGLLEEPFSLVWTLGWGLAIAFYLMGS